jgi:hypothetical protein
MEAIENDGEWRGRKQAGGQRTCSLCAWLLSIKHEDGVINGGDVGDEGAQHCGETSPAQLQLTILIPVAKAQ